ncbi:MAG: hypothetical protein R3298_03950 [Gammaproteobacteria bacterium]|nr:hypothetical protein [Gammaproteobacteria bacterium]
MSRLFTLASIAVFATALTACGVTDEERAITGSGIGGAAGYAVGAPVAGALVGGATGVFTEPDDVNMGEPIWEWD